MINIIARYAKPLFVLTTAAAIAGCDIGDGNKIEFISIDETVNSVRLDDCIGNRLTAIATFTDGSRVNFTDRVNWSSSDSSVASVTTRPTDRPAAFDEDFGFLLPGASANEGDTANISIEYFGLKSETPLEVTTTGTLLGFGLSINEATMAIGTAQTVNLWGRSSNDERIDLTQAAALTVDNEAAITLAEDFIGGVTASGLTDSNSPATLTAVYCGDTIKVRTATATISVVPDTPDSLILSASDGTLAVGTLTELRATALYSNGGFQARRTSTSFSQTSPGEVPELLFANSFNSTSASVGNFRVIPVATSGTHEVEGQYVDLQGNEVLDATGTIDITLLNTQLQEATPYRLEPDQGADILVNTNVDLTITGLFDLLDESGAVIPDQQHEQDVTDLSLIAYADLNDIEKVIVSNAIARAVSAGSSDFAVSSSVDNFVESTTVTITTHDDTNAVINSIAVSAVEISHKVYRLRAVANITVGSTTFDQDVSLNTAWETADSSVLHVDNSAAQAFGLATGGSADCATTTITAHFKGMTGSAVLNSATGEATACPS